MLDKLLTSLQEIPAYSIFISAVVVIFIAVSVLTMFGKARQEKEIEQLRWDKVSAHMALYDNARRVVIPLEADEILVGRHGAADIRFTDMSVSRYHAVLYVSNGTYVNGRKIRSQVKLKDMDEIRFGTKSVVIRQRRRGVRNV